jgi:L-alanine-DL-glutamate epimerase-like enolase superfamily enzyme
VAVYAGGGYRCPTGDLANLDEELRGFLAQGCTRVKIKIGADPLAVDLRRIETALGLLPSGACLAVDAMNGLDRAAALAMAAALAPFGLMWLEDICDPLDFETQAAVAAAYQPPIAAGEALFSLAEARLLDRHGGLRRSRDVLLFDPVHCYGLSHYLSIVTALEQAGWPRTAFWPHGGHLFSLHVAAGLGLGGSEVNPASFRPFGGLPAATEIRDGKAALGAEPGIGLEANPTPLA